MHGVGVAHAKPSQKNNKRRRLDSSEHVADITGSTCCLRMAGSSSNKCRLLGDFDEKTSVLSSLIAPLDVNIFLEKCFRSCAVHIHHDPGDDSRFPDVCEQLFGLDPSDIFKNTASESVFVWLQKKNKRIQSIEVSDPETALALHEAGHATYCRAPPELEQLLVPALLKDTGLGCGQYDPQGESVTCLGRGEIEVFLSNQGHLTDWHYDFQENFTLQLSGVKKWSLQKGTVKHPLRGCTPHYNSPEAVEPQLKAARLADVDFVFDKPELGKNALGEVETVLLRPGDVLYHPAGIWHKVEAIEEGVSINISLMATSYAAVTCQALQHYLMKKDEWRQCICTGSKQTAADTLKRLLKDLPSIIAHLEQDMGPDCILPPAVQQSRKNTIRIGSQSDESDDEEASSNGSVEDEDQLDDVVDGDKFESVGLEKEAMGFTLSKNPLATLIKDQEINDFYGGSKMNDPVDKLVCVLNVSYAGNESHESLVRVKISSSEWEKLNTALDHKIRPMPKELRSLISCLIHFGYLYWKPNKH